MPRRLFATLLVGFAACGAATDPTGPHPLGQQASPIVGGQPDTTRRAVGILISGSSSCSATLVGRRTVLTAAHCITASEVQLWVCDEGKASCACQGGTCRDGTAYVSQHVNPHPAYDGSVSTDIALVTLDRDVDGVVPVPINNGPLKTGQPITIVGFGQPDLGTRRVGENTIAALDTSALEFHDLSVTDKGDSGGPSLITDTNGSELVAGVHSKAGVILTQQGSTSVGLDSRVDAFADWILDNANGDVALPGQWPPAGDSNLPSGPATEGQSCVNRQCATDLACVSIFSSNQVQGKFCMERCEAAGNDPACDGGEVCTESRSAGRVCFKQSAGAQGFTNPSPDDAFVDPPSSDPSPPTAPDVSPNDVPPGDPAPAEKRAFGEPCEVSEECESNLCAVLYPGEGTYCTQECEASEPACPATSVCSALVSGAHLCGPPNALSRALAAQPFADGPESSAEVLTGGCEMGANQPSRETGNGLWLTLLLATTLLRVSRNRLPSLANRNPTRARHSGDP